MGLLQVLKLPQLPAQGARAASAKGGVDDKTATRLSQAAEAWRQTHRQANERIAALKASIKSHYASSHPDLLQGIEKSLAKLDEVLGNVDHRLADSLAAAGNAANDSVRNAELKNAKSILTEYIGLIKSQPLVAHLDENPFVKTDLKGLLVGGVTEAAKAIG